MFKKEKRFVKVSSEGSGQTSPACHVLVDRQTGVNYLFTYYGNSGGVTPLLNRDGTPIITENPNAAK